MSRTLLLAGYYTFGGRHRDLPDTVGQSTTVTKSPDNLGITKLQESRGDSGNIQDEHEPGHQRVRCRGRV